jgi:glycosyltransferase involved in cell wall biosynthesis
VTANRIRLGMYCPGNGTGGPWRYAHSILAALDPAEFEVTVFSDLTEYSPRPWVKAVPLAAAVEPATVVVAATLQGQPRRSPLARFAPPAMKRWAGFGREARRLARLIRQHPVDVFHTQNTGCEESPVAARLAGVPRVVGTFHVDSTYDLHRERSGPSYRLMEVVSNQCLDVGIAVSHETGCDWARRTRLPAARVTTIHNGIDPDHFRRRQSRTEARLQLGLPADAVIVGGLGRLDEAKGFELLIAAAAELRAEFPRLVVAIAGSGPQRERLEADAERRGVADRVRFLGFQSDVQPVLDAHDVFAMPSRCEALPYALLEAMATELPAVGAAVGGIPEVIVPGETGFVVPAKDATALAAALRTLLNDDALRTRMGVAGRERVARHFHERDMVRQTIQVYRDQHARGRTVGGAQG